MNRISRSIAMSFLAAACLAPPARAVIVPFDVNPDLPIVPAGVIPGGNFVGGAFTYYNIQLNVDGAPADINLRTSRAIDGGTPDQVTSDGFNGSSIVTKGGDSYLNTPFALGEVIGDGADEFQRVADQFSVLNDGGTTTYLPGSNYLGIRLLGGNYGYLHVNYEAASSTYTFTGGAYENSGAAIAAGAVPEATSLALASLAALGGVSVGRGRRRQ